MKKIKMTYLEEGSAYYVLQDLALGFQKSQLLFTAIKIDIFSLVNDGINTVDLIIERLDADREAMTFLLDGLVAISLLTKSGNIYANTTVAANHLVKSNDNYYGFVQNISSSYSSWSGLHDAVITGRNHIAIPMALKRDDYIEEFIINRDLQNKFEYESILPHVYLKDVHNILVTCAVSFRIPLEIARNNPNINVDYCDHPNILAIAERIIKKEYDCSNVNFISNEDDSLIKENHYDVILIDCSIDSFSVTDNVKLLRNYSNKLKSNGRLIVHQMLLDDTRTEPTPVALRSITMLLNTVSGSSFTYSDIWITLKEAGFRDISFEVTSKGSYIVTAKI